jgi:hypothetical protein
MKGKIEKTRRFERGGGTQRNHEREVWPRLSVLQRWTHQYVTSHP